MVHFKDAPPLKTLDQSQVFQMLEYDTSSIKLTKKKNTSTSEELSDTSDDTDNQDSGKSKTIQQPKATTSKKPQDEVNDKYITQVLYNYENKVLDEFFGNFIVNYFNTEEMKDRKFWTSDVSRLSFIIMQVVNRAGEKEWNHDKTGKKFVDLVIDPMFDEVVKLLDQFVNNKQKWIEENLGKVYIPPSKMTQLMHVQQLAKELQIDIKYNKFTRDILKFVAPHFNFDQTRQVSEQQKKPLEDSIKKKVLPKKVEKAKK
jgi:hypothetical protein